MKIRTKMLLVGMFLVFAPLVLAGLAGATYNPDGAVENPDGSWSIVNNYCVGVPASYVPNDPKAPTNNPGHAVKRTDLTAANCFTFPPPYYLTGIFGTEPACSQAGYIWLYSNCWPTMWSGDNPAAPGTWYTGLNGCLKCHNQTFMQAHVNTTEPAKESYLKTGHKNMLRKVTPGITQANAAGTPYSSVTSLVDFSSPLTPNWATGTVTDANGVSHQLYWIADGWMDPTRAPYAAFDNTPGTKAGYGCGRCHASGWTSDATPNISKEPELSFPGISSKLNLAGGVQGDSNAYSSWDQYGIQCSRCHQATDGSHATFPTSKSTGGDTVAMCANCHRQESGGIPLNQDSPGTKLSFGTSHGNVAFTSHGPVSQFLNSPHAHFTGSWGDIGCPPASISPAWPYTCDSSMSQYDPMFTQAGQANLGKGSTSGGCTTCHNIHKSTVAATGETEGTVACTSCHTNSTTDVVNGSNITPQIDLSLINHPSGSGTPLDYENPCAVCHMPGGEHLFRINIDPNYSTFPAGATSGLANTAPDGDYPYAVWNDIDRSCGQCHGGGVDGSGAKFLPMTKTQLAALAEGMHGAQQNTPPVAAMVGSPAVTISGHTVSFTDNSADADDEQSDLRVTVNWGDWTISTGKAGDTFTHTYKSRGKYTIIHSVRDPDNLTSSMAMMPIVIKGRSQKGN